MLTPVRITAPTTLPITLEAAKRQLRIEPDITLEDDLISEQIAAATDHLDGWDGILGRCLVEQEWRQDFEGVHDCLTLPLGPVISISSVKYLSNGTENTIDPSDYTLKTYAGGCSFVQLFTPVRGPVRVTYKAGYPDGQVPAAIRQAILLLVGAWYENREETAIGVSVSSLPESVAVRSLLAPYRRISI